VEERANDRGNGGVVILISPALAQELRTSEVVVPNRVIAAHFTMFTIVAVYMPTAQRPREQEKVYEELGAFTNKLSAHKYIVCGDFNARPKEQATTTILLNATHRLEDYVLRCKLHITNVHFPGVGTPKTHRYGTLDYIITSHKQAAAVCVKFPSINTDHRHLMTTMAETWTLPPRRQKRLQTLRPPDLHALQDLVTQRKFTTIARLMPHTALLACEAPTPWVQILSGTAAHTYSTLCASSSTARSILPRVQAPKRSTTWRHGMVLDMIRLNEHTGMLDPSHLVNILDSLDVQEHTRLLGEYAEQLRSNPRLAWKCIGATLARTNAILPAETKQHRNDLFHRHFSALLSNDDVPPNLGQLPPTTRKDIVWRTGVFTIEEIQKAIQTLPSGKSAGIDALPNEVLKIPTLFIEVMSILRSMQKQLDQEQRTSMIVPLPKKGDLSQLGNWRGISLMPHITKLFDKLLLHRLRDAIDVHLNCAQNGFRPNRGTVHHATAGTMILELVRQTKQPLHGCFIDFSKAFDSVKWNAIVEELCYWGAPSDFVQMTMSVMCGHTVRVRTDGMLSEEIPVGVGVLQGDTLAPYLFIMVLDKILRELPTDAGFMLGKMPQQPTIRQQAMYDAHETTRIPAMAFADDIMLLSNHTSGLQQLVTAIEKPARRVGLLLNMGRGKTEQFVVNDEAGTVRTLDGQEIPVVTDYKYLGINIFRYETDFKRRKKVAWAVITRYKGTWKSNAPWDIKRSLFSALVEPLLSYGLVAWAMTTARQRQLDGLHARLLRAALGLPPAIVSREHAPTERIYGTMPFFTEQMAQRRVAFFGHALREHERGILHRVIEVLKFQPERRKETEWAGGGRRTVQRGLMLDCQVAHVDTLTEILRDRTKCRRAAKNAASTARKVRIAEVMRRRPEGYVYPVYHANRAAINKTTTVKFKTTIIPQQLPKTDERRGKRLDDMSEEELRLMMM
jgi:hypothetical protein